MVIYGLYYHPYSLMNSHLCLVLQPYEQAGNSIGYQLLHQNNSEVTTELIDRLYPALKVLTHTHAHNAYTLLKFNQ